MSRLARLKHLPGKAVDFFFPVYCLGCRREGEFICFSCRQTLPRLIGPVCPRCGRPFTIEDYCSSCRQWKLEIDGIRSVFRFEGIVRQAIYQFKYQNVRALALPLAMLLWEYWQGLTQSVEMLVPVPLHPQRLRERGYNQSVLLVRELGKITGLPVVDKALSKVKNSLAQAKAANAEARWQNVAGAFACISQELYGKKVLLIDDVCTTGATLDSCAIALKKAGVHSVWGLTIAREA